MMLETTSPRLPAHVVVQGIVPFLDRNTFYNISLASKEVNHSMQRITIPWPKIRLKSDKIGVQSMTFSSNSDVLLCRDYNGRIAIWNRKNGKQVVVEGLSPSVGVLACSPDNRLFVCAGKRHKTPHLRALSDGSLIRILHGHQHSISSAVFSPCGKWVATSTRARDSSIRLWDVSTGECDKIFLGNRGSVYSVAFSPDGQLLASGGTDRRIRIWNQSDGSCQEIRGHDLAIVSVAFSPTNGNLLVSASIDRTVRIWDVAKKLCLHCLELECEASKAVFSPDGTQLATTGLDDTIKFWNVHDASLCSTLSGDTISFAPDGQTVATRGKDGFVQLR